MLAEICYQLDKSQQMESSDTPAASEFVSDKEILEDIFTQADFNVNIVNIEVDNKLEQYRAEGEQLFTVFE